MSKQCTKPRRKQDDSWFKDKVLLVQAQASGQILHEEELAFLVDLGIPEDALAESNVVNHSKTEITSDSNIIPYSHINDTLTAELERYKEQVKVLDEGQNVALTYKDNVSDSCAQSIEIDRLKQTLSEHLKEKESLMQTVSLLKDDFKKEEPRNIDIEIALEKRIKQLDNILEPKLYVGDIIEKTNPIMIPDSGETLMLAEESRSKMLLKQKDPIMLEKKVNTTPVDNAALNQLYKDFETHFVPQTELSSEQAFWSQNSVNSPKPILSNRPTIVEVPKELPKVSMVNTSLKKLKHHLASFDVVVKERTTPTAITKGLWGFEHTKAYFRDEIISFVKALKDLFNSFNQYLVDELSEVQNVFHQMEQAVEQHHLESQTFECLQLETELQTDFIEKEIYDKLFKSFTTLEKYCISLEVDSQLNQEIFQRDNFVSNQSAPSFDQLFELNELKAQSQEKDTVIKKLKERINALRVKPSTSASGSQPSGNTKKDKIRQTPSSTQMNKVEAHPRKVKSSFKNKDCVVQPKGTSHVQHSKRNGNSELKCVKCNGCMLSDNHDLCVLDFINNVNACKESKSVNKSSKSKVWKPTGKVITTTTEVPLKKLTTLENETSKPVVTLVYSRKPRKSKTIFPVSKSTVLKSVSANKKKPSKSWGSKVSDVPSSSLDECRLGMLRYQGFTTWKDLDTTYSSLGNFVIRTLKLLFVNTPASFSSPIFLLSKASKTKSWLWHRRLSNLNFGAINHLARHGLVRGLPKLKFKKDHLCSACAMGKSKKKPHKPKSEDTNQEKLYLLHMDLCGPMCVASVNGKKYILVIVDDYSRFTWVKFLRSKDEAPDFIIKFLKMIQVRLQVTVRRIRTDNGTEFVNQTLCEYYEKIGISHETSVARSPQQNGVVERRNRTLIEAACTMLIYAKAPLFLWAEAVATACYTQNRSIIRLRHGKTPYELLHDKPPDLSFFHVFGALCYPTNDSENLDFDELTAMASEHSSSGPALHEMTPATISSGLVPNPPPSTPFVPPSRTDWDILFQPMFDELLTPPPSVDLPAPEVIAQIDEVVAPVPAVSTGSPSSTTVDQDAPSPSNSQTTPETQPPIIPNDVEEDNHDIEVAHMGNDPYFGLPIPEIPSDQSSSSDSIHTIVHTINIFRNVLIG
ncbi:retrovirus-related pol polyprotein from transposon TNT 1-94 [Tanacetum coccineum]